MGSGISFKEVGKSFDNTVTTSDITSLHTLGMKPRKISHIRVYTTDYIVGFECYYDGISAGARQGFEFNAEEAKVHDFELQTEEFFTKVTGTTVEVVDSLVFHTSVGRTFKVGTYRHGGTTFELSKPNKVISYFNVGFGRYLHTFRCYFGKRPRRLNSRQIAQYYNTNINNSILSTSSMQSSRSVQRGIVATSYSNVMPSITVSAQRPQVLNASYYHGVGAQYQRPVSAPSLMRTQPLPRKEVRAQRTLFGGLKYENTIEFDDYSKHIKGHSEALMVELRVIHDEFCIYGFQPIYEIGKFSYILCFYI